MYQGGIGSYALLVMVAAFLLLHPSRGGPGGDVDLEANLGVLLMDFLRLYGRSLNTIDVGVSCRQEPSQIGLEHCHVHPGGPAVRFTWDRKMMNVSWCVQKGRLLLFKAQSGHAATGAALHAGRGGP